MYLTLLPIVTEVKPLQPEKAELPMDVTPSPIIISLMDVIPLNQELTFLQLIVTEVKPLQPSKAKYPMEVTLVGMVNDVKPLQPLKA